MENAHEESELDGRIWNEFHLLPSRFSTLQSMIVLGLLRYQVQKKGSEREFEAEGSEREWESEGYEREWESEGYERRESESERPLGERWI